MFTTIVYKKKLLLFQLKDVSGLYSFELKTISSSALVKTKWVVIIKKSYNYYDILNKRSHSHAIDEYIVITSNHKGGQYTRRCD